MRSLAGYAGAAVGTVTVASAALWPWLEPEGRHGVVLAGGAALAAQLPALWLLLRCPPERFVGPWAAGMGFRLLAVALVTAAAVLLEGVAATPALLGVAGFLFALLVLEAVLLWRVRPPAGERRGADG